MKNIPVIFWHSDPVGPNETVVFAGGNFAPNAVVELAPLPGKAKGPAWTAVKPLQVSEISIKAVIPAAWAPGVYAARIKQGDLVSKVVYVNEPDIWWKQGDEGVDRARQGGWLRILGKSLAIDGQALMTLQAEDGKESTALKLETVTTFDLKAKIPTKLKPGRYTVLVSNGTGGKEGVRDAGALELLPAKPEPKVINVVESLGADPTGLKDSTLAIVQAIERVSMLGGGVVYFPRGRYRIDSILRSGTWIKSPLIIPENVTLRGESPATVSLWWPDQEKALPTLIDGHNDFAIENLSIFTQGFYSTIITGSSNVRIHNVRIRANRYYMTNPDGQPHHLRAFPKEKRAEIGPAILLWGENNQVTHCDILHNACVFDLRGGRGSLIAHNKIRAANMHTLNGTSEVIFEHNENTGNSMVAGGNNIGLHMGASICKNTYYAFNKTTHLYGGDHEAFTLDGHATAYLGKVADIQPLSFKLTVPTFLGDKSKGAMQDMHGAAAYIVDGKGVSQYRWVTGYEGDKITIDREWDLAPDKDSLIGIAGFNGRHLFIGNTAEDTGTLIQLYPPNAECIVAGNRSIHASNINSLGKLRSSKDSPFVRVEPSWYNQYLDNHIIAGNTWGGGTTQIDRWIGGECMLNIWGWETHYFGVEKGESLDQFFDAEIVQKMLGESKPRAKTIPISRFQIIRRHKVDNNSSIRVHGAVADVLIEGSDLKHSAKGIRIDQEMDYKLPPDLGPLFDFDPAPSEENRPLPFLTPEGVVIRNNTFDDVQIPYSGTALGDAVVIEK